ncbi:hypothetical protein GCM10023262_10620 [Bartonella pachyuromydis]|uniref:Uncharacterized protein n=2 Tax=Bartonella pachyuromydis TaxID=931097 RepID=A0ABP8VH87_9HYPH
MFHFKTYSNIGSYRRERNFLKKIWSFLKEPTLIGSLNGSLSGAVAVILATYGYIALPGFGPIITMGIAIALSIGMTIGALIGSIIGIFVGVFYAFMGYLHRAQ